MKLLAILLLLPLACSAESVKIDSGSYSTEFNFKDSKVRFLSSDSTFSSIFLEYGNAKTKESLLKLWRIARDARLKTFSPRLRHFRRGE